VDVLATLGAGSDKRACSRQVDRGGGVDGEVEIGVEVED
jgi:hypothetical protein